MTDTPTDTQQAPQDPLAGLCGRFPSMGDVYWDAWQAESWQARNPGRSTAAGSPERERA